MFQLIITFVVLLSLYFLFKTATKTKTKTKLTVSKLYVHPVKSCKPMSVDKWYVDKTGLLHDRK